MSGEDSEEAGLRCSRPSIARIQYFAKYFIKSIAVRTIVPALVIEEKGVSEEVATCLQLRPEQECREGLQHSATGVLDGRRSVLEFSDMQKKKLLQRPTSLEITR
jgi:hypothetical protein